MKGLYIGRKTVGAGFLRSIINFVKDTERRVAKFTDSTDYELIELFVKDNDQDAFEEIFNRYVDKIYGISLRITRNPARAEEVLQEVFLTLITKADTFRGEAKFSSWLYRVTVNTSFMHLRAEKKYESTLSLENYVPYDEKGTLMGRIKAKDWSSRPDILIFRKEGIELIEKAVNELPESYRVVFHLRDVEGLSNEEISNILDLTIPAVKSRLHRARLFLRDRLSDYFDEWVG
ncbi:MAG: sigma-70 family RNA polymerase sigma factor [Thermodesulfobacteriota bacterium]